jgi:ABC-type amino acid transport system permease subunit
MSSKTIHIINEILSWIVSGVPALVAVVIIAFVGYKILEQQEKDRVAYRAQLIQELCERSDYDFCEIEKIIYKERVEEDVDK